MAMEVPELDYRATMPALIRHAVESFGDTEYIVMPDRRMTFAQADAASRRFAKQLLAAGVGKGTRVGIMFPNGTDWVVAWLGATRIGALFMPFSSTYKPAELRKALLYGDVDTLIVPPTLIGRDNVAFIEDAIPGLDASGSAPLRISAFPYLRSVWVGGGADRPWAHRADLDFRADAGDSPISDAFLDAIEAEVAPADLLCTIFTSGTTSEPKAVNYTHGAFVRHGANQVRFSGAIGAPDRKMFCSAPFFWIGGLGQLNYSLVTSHTLLCTERFDPGPVLDLMEAEGSQFFGGWPPIALRLRQHIQATGRDVSRIPAFASARPPGLRHLSLGMTESIGPHSAPGPEADRLLPDELHGSFGLPIPHIQLRIIDPETGMVLGDEQEGELTVRGYSLMEGLYKKERHEYLDDDGWYRTGDKCLFRQGYVIFHGRLGEMIKTAGSNVAPREVEEVLESVPEVGMAIVLGVPDGERNEIVGAVVSPRGDARIDTGQVIERLSSQLSAYKVPRAIVVLADHEVPVLPNGKPDKRRLREMLLSAPRR
jgi:acyl-CoA synthetase (AMP-forming)/AMP-acid ligase II